MRAWHFLYNGHKLRDGRTAPDDGVMLAHPGKPELCRSGLHASLRPFDALYYAPGNILCLVECGGVVIHATDKLVCTERTIIARFDATKMLGYHARMQALKAIEYWDAPDVVLEYIMTGRGREAAYSAANSAANSAAYSAARSAAYSAANSAAYSANSAARSAAYSAAYSAANSDFDALVFECFENVL